MALDERTLELFDRYKSTFEDIFPVSLDNVWLGSVGKEFYTELDTAAKRAYPDMNPFYLKTNLVIYKTLIRLANTFAAGMMLGLGKGKDTTAFLLHQLDGKEEKDIAYVLVHELAHLTYQRLFGITQSQPPRSEGLVPLKRIKMHWLDLCISEGFAEYTAIRTFAPHYGMPQIQETIEDRLYMYNTGELSPRGKAKSSLFTRALFAVIGKTLIRPYSEGFQFFDQVCHHGFSSLDVLANPPRSYAEIKHPHVYLERRFTIEHTPSSLSLGSPSPQ